MWTFNKNHQNILNFEPRFPNKISDYIFHLASISCWPPARRCGSQTGFCLQGFAKVTTKDIHFLLFQKYIWNLDKYIVQHIWLSISQKCGRQTGFFLQGFERSGCHKGGRGKAVHWVSALLCPVIRQSNILAPTQLQCHWMYCKAFHLPQFSGTHKNSPNQSNSVFVTHSTAKAHLQPTSSIRDT